MISGGLQLAGQAVGREHAWMYARRDGACMRGLVRLRARILGRCMRSHKGASLPLLFRLRGSIIVVESSAPLDDLHVLDCFMGSMYAGSSVCLWTPALTALGTLVHM